MSFAWHWPANYLYKSNNSGAVMLTNQEIAIKQGAFDIPGFHESVKRDFDAGLITLEEAAREFCKANWTPYINMAYTKKHLGIEDQTAC